MTQNTDEGAGTGKIPPGSQVPPLSFDVQRDRAQARVPAPPQSASTYGTHAMTRALRSHQLWLTVTYFGLLVLMAKGLSS